MSGRQIDASADHNFAVRQNEQSSRALPDVGDGNHFAASPKCRVERAIRIVTRERTLIAWVRIADGDDFAIGLDGNATQPVNAVVKVRDQFPAVTKV